MYYHNNELPPQQGWICPKCGRVNAPWMPTCGCVSSQTSGSGTHYLVKTSSISRDSHEVADTPQTETKTETQNSNVISVSVGVSEAVRCAMCSNPNKSDRGCEGACSYDEKLYKRIMEAIDESRVDTPQTDCGANLE